MAILLHTAVRPMLYHRLSAKPCDSHQEIGAMKGQDRKTSYNSAMKYTVACDLIGKGVMQLVCVCVFSRVCLNRGQTHTASDDSNHIL